MKITRKDFLRISGLSLLLGLAGKEMVRAVTGLAAPATAAVPATKKVRWGMVIDLAKWRNEDHDACIRACNAAHNIPQIPNPTQEVRWIWDEPFEAVFPSEQTSYTRQNYAGNSVPVMCNHCDNPACVRVCPTGATWKREEDGIVMMDWHRCIGCKYCVVACPYGARSFNFTNPAPYVKQINPDFPTRSRGVVEKCNFCVERLDKGKQPSCVEACASHGMVFGNLEDPDSEVRQLLRTRFTIRRKPELGTQPNVFYIV